MEHAEWRVNFVRSLLASHRLLLARGSDWYLKEAGMVNRLAHAKEKLREVRELTSNSEPGKRDSQLANGAQVDLRAP
jgi:hypothetical protein